MASGSERSRLPDSMAYQPLELAPSLPRFARSLLQEGLEPILRDVHCMLRLPVPSVGLDAGCNVGIALSLLSVIAGISATCYRDGLSDSAGFVGLLMDYYPWELERDEEDGDDAVKANTLWTTFRNPLSHSLGLMFEKRGRTGRVFDPKPFMVIINRERGGSTEDQIEALERGEPRPHMHPTITIGEDFRMLSVEPLYWGVRVMLSRLTNDSDQMILVENRISEGMASRRRAT